MNIVHFAFLALLSAGTSLTQETNTWRKDGVPIADRPNMKSKDGFAAQLFLTDDARFFDNWSKPQTPHLTPLTKAQRNVPFFTAILFVDPQLDDRGEANVTCDITIRKPDGSVYGEELDATGWKGPYPVSPHNLQLSLSRMGVLIEPQDPAGTYTVEVIVRDHNRTVDLTLRTTFDVQQ